MMPDRLLSLGVRALRAGRPGRPSLPYKLNLLVTTRCNQRCLLCRIWEKEAQDLPLDHVRLLFDRSAAFSWVDISGGEIFLRADIREIFEIVIKRCRRLALLHFPTNGSLPDTVTSVTREVLALRPPRLVVTVSLDGPPDLHDRLRGQEGAFGRAVETYRRLRELRGCRVFFGLTLSDENLTRFGETLESLGRAVPGWDPQDLHVNLAGRSSHYYANQDVRMPESRQIAAGVRAILEKRTASHRPLRFLEYRYLQGVLQYLDTGRGPTHCTALRATCTVAADGTLYPCITWNRSLGRLPEWGFDLGRMWRDPVIAAIADGVRRDECPGCWTPCEAIPSLLGDPFSLFRKTR